MAEWEHLVCPVCGMNRKIDKKLKGRIKFGIDLENGIVLQYRTSEGYKSLKVIGGLTLKEMVEEGKYLDLLRELKEECLRVYNYLDKLGI